MNDAHPSWRGYCASDCCKARINPVRGRHGRSSWDGLPESIPASGKGNLEAGGTPVAANVWRSMLPGSQQLVTAALQSSGRRVTTWTTAKSLQIDSGSPVA